MEDLKRIRNANWSEQEKKTLRMLVLDRADIIEKKDATTHSNAAKKLAWEEVLSCFNTVSVNKRNKTQLLNQWRNMKNNAKKSEFAYRRERMMTGGGPPPPSPPAVDRELIDAIPNEFTVDSNVYDADSIYTNQLKKSPKTNIPIETEASAVLHETSQVTPKRLETVQSTPQRPYTQTTPAPKRLRPSTSPRTNAVQRKNKDKSNCCRESHEHQLFILAKTAREEAMMREKEAHECKMRDERELHERRMNIMNLEEDYWKRKIMELK